MASTSEQAEKFLQKFGLPAEDPLIMSTYDKLFEDLQELGLNSKEAKILLYLIIRKHSSAADISRHNDIGRTEAYNFISNLMKMGIVFSTFDRPQKYYALPLEQVFDHLIESRKMVLDRLAESKSEYCQMLDKISSSIVVSEAEERESYQVLGGENSITSAIKRIIASAHKELVIFVGERTLMHFYHAGLIDDTLGAVSRDVAVSLHTSCGRVSEFVNPDPRRDNLAIKTVPDTTSDFVIVDNREIVVIMQDDKVERPRMQGFYTNNVPIINVFRTFFEKTA